VAEKRASTHAGVLARERLSTCLQEQAGPLLGAIRAYVQRAGLAQGDEVPAAALEVFQEMAAEALAGSDRFDPDRQPAAWLLGIALNVIRRMKVEHAKRLQRELPVSQMAKEPAPPMTEHELFDQLPTVHTQGPELEVEAADEAESLLALVSPADQAILRLALMEDYTREALADRFDTTVGAVRVRLHRALGRLRAAWAAGPAESQKGTTQ
jgi:RNA polymerase sigma factor (sigma-70 family)